MNAKQKEQTIEEIKKLLEENNGIVKAEKLYPLGLTYKSIQGLVKAGILDHVKSGYYSMGYEEKPQEEIILVSGWNLMYGQRPLLLRLY